MRTSKLIQLNGTKKGRGRPKIKGKDMSIKEATKDIEWRLALNEM